MYLDHNQGQEGRQGADPCRPHFLAFVLVPMEGYQQAANTIRHTLLFVLKITPEAQRAPILFWRQFFYSYLLFAGPFLHTTYCKVFCAKKVQQ